MMLSSFRLSRLPLMLTALTFACAGVKTIRPEAQPQAAPELEIVSNDVVMAQVRHLTGTPGARQHLRSALARRKTHLAAVHAALSAQHLPLQLDAIPLIESGYENLDGGKNGAGLWQFVTPTALHYGLRISSEVDERMNPALETAAAARYLRDLYRELHGGAGGQSAEARSIGDWPLVLAAYAQGGSFVRAAIKREKTRDVWELIRRGALSPYAARVMAAALIISEPLQIDQPPWGVQRCDQARAFAALYGSARAEIPDERQRRSGGMLHAKLNQPLLLRQQVGRMVTCSPIDEERHHAAGDANHRVGEAPGKQLTVGPSPASGSDRAQVETRGRSLG